MRTFLRVLMWTGIGIATIAVVLALVAVRVVRRPFPDVRGTDRLAGLDAPVEILRDEIGVPHIWASSRHDLYFAQGYVHAQDRFWQMEFSRRVGSGTLSEILGESTVDSDRFLRTMGFKGTAEAEYAALGEPYRGYLQAYADGVNAWIADRRPGQLGLEFTLLGLSGTKVDVEPWTPVNSLTWGKVMAYDLGANLPTELANITLRRFGGNPLQKALRPPFRSDFPYIVTMGEVMSSRTALGLPQLPTVDPNTTTYTETDAGKGSNNWVISGNRTQSGLPLLANDMHLGEQMPSIWYEVGLHLREPDSGETTWSVRGYSFPGVPGIVAGQNDRIAWGVTNVGGDVQDTHEITVAPDDPDRYLIDGQWRAMDVSHEMIRVAGEEMPVRHDVRTTVFGPVISDLPQYTSWFSYRIDAGTPDPVSVTELALEWPALRPEHTVEAILDLNYADDYASFRRAVSRWDSPGQNVVYADRDGNIAYQTTGSYPNRSVDRGQLPISDRDAPEPDVPFRDLPFALNPGKGFIVTTNQPVVPPEYPYPLGEDFAPGRRAARITELITSITSPISADDLATIQGDVYSIAAADVIAPLATMTAEEAIAAWESYLDSRLGPGGADGAADRPIARELARERADARDADRARAEKLVPDALAMLGDWDAHLDGDSPAAAVYGYLFDELVRQTLSDEVPAYEWPITSDGAGEDVLHELLQRPGDSLWDDRATPEREDARTILGRSIVLGVLALADDQGMRPRRWSWGEAHQITFRNQSLGMSGIGFIERLLNRGPYPLAGGPTTVNVAHWSTSDPFDVTAIPSERAIYDLSDPSKSRFVHTTGQSGHPFNRHYADMIEPWREVRYHPSYWTYEEARRAAGGRRLVLEPIKE